MNKLLLATCLLIPLTLSSCLGISYCIKDVRSHAEPAETIVLLHGLGRGNLSMWWMARRLKSAGYDVKQVGYSSWFSPPEDILKEVTAKIDKICTTTSNTVHFVGHSMGGLLVRNYLSRRDLPNLGRVVLTGTPNKGTPLVDEYRDRWWLKTMSPAALALGSDMDGIFKELPRPDYELGIIAGITKDSLLSDQIPGEDDGIVPLTSTRLEGMSDFITVSANHVMMRYDEEVSSKTIEFIKTGSFSVQQKEE